MEVPIVCLPPTVPPAPACNVFILPPALHIPAGHEVWIWAWHHHVSDARRIIHFPIITRESRYYLVCITEIMPPMGSNIG